MSQLIDRLSQQFKSKFQYQKFMNDCEQKFDIKSYRFQLMTQYLARKTYYQLKEKYDKKQYVLSPRTWYQNQRKLFVWSLLALIKLLSERNQQIQQQHWRQLSACYFHKQILFLKYQFNVIQKRKKRNPWSQQQDQIVKSCQQFVENNNWNQIAKEIFFRTNGKAFKCPKQIRERWQNHLNKNVKKQPYTKQQDFIILNFVLKQGKKWAQIVDQLKNTRTQHMIKNRYKSLVAKYQSISQQKQSQEEIVRRIIENINQNQNINININIHSNNNSVSQRSRSGSQNHQINEEKSSSFEEERDKVEQEKMDLFRSSNMKKTFHGCIERGQNGQFVNERINFQATTPFIFQSRSPACLSFASSFLATSYTLFNSQNMTPSNQINSNFLTQTQKWSNFLSKKSTTVNTNLDEQQGVTQKLFGIRSDSWHRLSHQYNDISQGSIKSTIFSPAIDKLQTFLIGKQGTASIMCQSTDFQFKLQKVIDSNQMNEQVMRKNQ